MAWRSAPTTSSSSSAGDERRRGTALTAAVAEPTRATAAGSVPAPAAGATRSRSGDGARLLLVIAAVAVGVLAYHDYFPERLPWWRWSAELGIAWLLLILGLAEPSPAAESAARRWLRRAAGVAALVALAIALDYGQRLGDEAIAGAAAVAAVVLFLLWRWVPFDPADVRDLLGEPPEAPYPAAQPRPLHLAGAALAVILVAIAPIYTAHSHLGAFLLWVGGMGLFAVAVWRMDRPCERRATPHWLTSGGPQLSPAAEAIGLLLVLVLAAALRLILLADYPSLIGIDEGLLGRHAESIWKTGFPDPFGIGWNSFAHLAYMIGYLGVQLFGTSNHSLRLVSAVIGILSLVPFFYWVRRWWGNVIALLAVIILTINHEHIYWSRISLNNIDQVLVATLMLAAFARLLHTRRLIDWVWFGYAMGLGFHTYHSAKLYPALIAGAALFFAIGIRGFLRRYAAGALVGAIAFLLFFGPLVPEITRQWQRWYIDNSDRMDVHELVDAYDHGDAHFVRAYIDGHFGSSMRMFINEPPRLAIFSPAMCVPFLLGVGWLLWRWRDPRLLICLAWVGGMLLLGSLTYAPRLTRLIGILPVVCLLPALIAGRTRALLYRLFPRRADLIAVPILLVWLCSALYASWDAEFIYRAAERHVTTGICRLIDRTESPATFYTAGADGSEDPRVASSICMIAADPLRTLVNLADDPRIVPVPPANHGKAVLLLMPSALDLLPFLQHYYPGVAPEAYIAGDRTEMYSVTIPPEQLDASRGLRAAFDSGERKWMPERGVDGLAVGDADAVFPVRARARGLVWIESPGTYRFRGRGGDVWLDEKPAVADEAHMLAAGWHEIELRATLQSRQERAWLEWQRPDGNWAPIPRDFTSTHPEVHGLLGRYFGRPLSAAETAQATPDYAEIAPLLAFDYQANADDPPPPAYAAKPSTMEWSGSVDLPEGDEQGLRLEATSPTEVFLDDRLVLESSTVGPSKPLEVALSGLTGRVAIRVRSLRPATDPTIRWQMRLLWRTAGGGWTAFARYHPDEMH